MGEKIKKDDIIKALLDMAFAHSTSGTSLSDIAGALGIKKRPFTTTLKAGKTLFCALPNPVPNIWLQSVLFRQT